MEITRLEPIVLESAVGTVSLPGGKADFDATVRPVLVRVHTDEGVVGLGETYLDDPTGDKAAFVARGVEALAAHVVGEDPRNVRDLWHEMYVHTKRSGSYRSLSAIDEALWDIKGKAAGVPVYELLGGTAGEVSAYATFPHRKPADELVEAGEWLAEKGFETMKIVVGRGVESDRERIRAVAEGIPDELGLAMDANTTFDFPDALSLARTASEHEMEWFEEPIAHTDVAGMAELNRRVPVPVAAYQNNTTQYPATDMLAADALEIYQPAFDYCGGITPSAAVATLCEAHNKRFVPHAFGPVVNYSASLHVAAASPACSLIEFAVYAEDVDDPGRYVASPYVENQEDVYVRDGGRIDPPEAPGLGLEVDEAVLEEYRTD
ncbi:MAG: mandelate racemase/muconate lactonizing enzyme family protein [Halobacteriaceae archaeon]